MDKRLILISILFVLFSFSVLSSDLINFTFPESLDYVFIVDRGLNFDYSINDFSDSLNRAHICFFPESYFKESSSFNDDYCGKIKLSSGDYSFSVRRNILLDDYYIPVFLSQNDKIVYDKIKINYDYSHYPGYEGDKDTVKNETSGDKSQNKSNYTVNDPKEDSTKIDDYNDSNKSLLNESHENDSNSSVKSNESIVENISRNVSKKHYGFSSKNSSVKNVGEKFELRRTYGKDKETMPAKIISENEVEIETSSVSAISKVRFRNLKLDKDIALGIEMVEDNSNNLGSFSVNSKSKNSKAQSYAIDPEKLNFTSADVTIKAKGTEVHKCNDWNFSTQTCHGEWVLLRDDLVPGQEYNITITPDDPGFIEYINISKAYHLDESRGIVDDVYDIVSELNGNVVRINESQFLRAKFEENLTSKKDITIYAESVNNESISIEVYEVGTTKLVATFENVNNYSEYKVFLSNLEGYQDSFDLKIIGGDILIDHIIDPLTLFQWSVDVESDWNNATNQHYSTMVGIDNLTLNRTVVVDEISSVGTSSWDVPSGILKANILLVGGGGGGAGYTSYSSAGGGGGGAGGLIYKENFSLEQDSYSITVGDGGAGVDSNSNPAPNGEDTTGFGLTALGGGGGILTGGGDDTPASDGGSGGGGRQNPAGNALQPTSSWGGFGNDGSRNSDDAGGGAGGGAGEEPSDITGVDGGDAGDGLYFGDVFGDTYGDSGYFAGGGAGGGDDTGIGGLGGLGGGGDGSSPPSGTTPTTGMSNTGGGGGGGSSSHVGADGGSGIVLIKYGAPQINTWESIYWDTGYDDQSDFDSFEVNTDIYSGQAVSFRVGVDENNDGVINSWSNNLTLIDGFNYFDHNDISLPKGYGYKIEFVFNITDDTNLPKILDYTLEVKESCDFMISTCQELNQPGIYCLENDILDISTNNCFDVSSNDVRLFGKGYQISGDGSTSDYGIYLSRASSEASNFEVEDLKISNFLDSNIFIENGNLNSFENISVTNSSNHGFNFINSGGNIIEDSFSYNNQYGINLNNSNTSLINNTEFISNDYGVFSNSENLTLINSKIIDSHLVGLSHDSNISSTFYNNLFNNSNNFVILQDFYNVWNKSLFPKTNIVNGTFVGGNVWSTPTQNGFSDKCYDGDDDGICDYSYDFFGDDLNVDYLPLAISSNKSWYAIYDFYDGNTTEFNSLGFIGIQNVSNAILENTSFGKISWENCVNATSANFDSYVNIKNNSVIINSSNLDSSFNTSANITLYNVELLDPVILKDGIICSDCLINSYDGSNISFSVNSSGNFTVFENFFDDDLIHSIVYEMVLGIEENQTFSLNYSFQNLDEDDVYSFYDTVCYLDINDTNYLMDYEGDGVWSYEENYTEGRYDFIIECSSDIPSSQNYSSTFIVNDIDEGYVSFESLGYNEYNVLSNGLNVYTNDSMDSFSGSYNTLHDFGDYFVFEELIDVDLLFSNFSHVFGLGLN